jgi:hypothetical protein
VAERKLIKSPDKTSVVLDLAEVSYVADDEVVRLQAQKRPDPPSVDVARKPRNVYSVGYIFYSASVGREVFAKTFGDLGGYGNNVVGIV